VVEEAKLTFTVASGWGNKEVLEANATKRSRQCCAPGVFDCF
jgi:hypothetical protein